MTKLTAVSPDKKIRDLVIPGTHNSASVTIPKWTPLSAVGLCQNLSVFEQLRRGARYLDLRIGGRKSSSLIDDIVIIHGILRGSPFPDVVDEIDRFLTDNPREFVTVEIIYEQSKHPLTSDQRIRAFELLSSTFNKTMIRKDDVDSWFDLRKVTLGELDERQKNVLVLINNDFFGFSHDGIQYDLATISRDFDCHENGNFVKNKWHNTTNARSLLRSNGRFLEEAEPSKFMNSQFVMTPQPPGSASDVFLLLLGAKSLRPVSLARALYRKDLMESFIRDNADDTRWNIVLLDFLDLCPQLVAFLIGLNYSKQLKIKQALITPKDGTTTIPTIDVTKVMEKLKSRNCCIYLLDFKEDLEIPVNEGKLRLKAQFDGEDEFDRVIPFDQNTTLLI